MKTLRIGLEWFMNPDHLPFLVGLDKGWFAEAGLAVELIEPQQHMDAIEAIEKGDMDVAVTEPLHLVEDAAQGHDAVGFARFLHTNGGVMYFAESDIRRPRDMVGKRIQYPGAPGPGGPAIVLTMARADGAQATASDFGRVDNGFMHTGALIEGKADVATLVFYNFEVVEARERGRDARFFALKDWGVPDFCQLILITHGDIFKRDKAHLQALVRVLSRGIDFLRQQPLAAREIYMRHMGARAHGELAERIFEATAPCFTHDFSMAPQYYEKLAGWMREYGLIEKPLDTQRLWTNELAL